MNKQNTQVYKHRNCIIHATPTEQHPNMVKIIKTPKVREVFLDRRYVSLEHAHKQIELFESERLIKQKGKYIKSELSDVVVIDEGVAGFL